MTWRPRPTRACSEVLSLDDVGHVTVTVPEVPAWLEADVLKAAGNCPERAITVLLAGARLRHVRPAALGL
jgi:hypothetical protein